MSNTDVHQVTNADTEGAKFTPGPWKTLRIPPNNLDNGTAMVATSYRGGMAIDCMDSGPTWEESAMNATLIAAAPALYEALEDMLAGWQYIRRTHGDLYGVGWNRAEEKARAALRLASGKQGE